MRTKFPERVRRRTLKPIPGFPGYKLRIDGRIVGKDGRLLKPKLKLLAKGPVLSYTMRRFQNDQRGAKPSIIDLMEQVFGRMEALRVVRSSWYQNFLEHRKEELEIKEPDEAVFSEEVVYTRRCTTCGAPTNNYRCDKCWKRMGRNIEDEEDDWFKGAVVCL